jgi:hypothetical protein
VDLRCGDHWFDHGDDVIDAVEMQMILPYKSLQPIKKPFVSEGFFVH